MKAAGYVRPASIAEAAAARADGGIIIAGGTDVMVKGRARGVYAGRTLVEVSKLEELRQVHEQDGAVEIGAACTLAELCEHALIAGKLPLLADACAHVGGVQIRNRATIGGNVVNACPASDVIPALMVLGACVRTTARELPLDGLFRACPACLRHEGMLVRTCYFPDAAAKNAVVNGECEFTACLLQQGLEEYKVGNVNFLCVLSTEPARALPKVPLVVAEYPGFGKYLPWGAFYGVFAKKGTDPAIIKTLAGAFEIAGRDAGYQTVLENFDVNFLGYTGEDASKYVSSWRKNTVNALKSSGALD